MNGARRQSSKESGYYSASLSFGDFDTDNERSTNGTKRGHRTYQGGQTLRRKNSPVDASADSQSNYFSRNSTMSGAKRQSSKGSGGCNPSLSFGDFGTDNERSKGGTKRGQGGQTLRKKNSPVDGSADSQSKYCSRNPIISGKTPHVGKEHLQKEYSAISEKWDFQGSTKSIAISEKVPSRCPSLASKSKETKTFQNDKSTKSASRFETEAKCTMTEDLTSKDQSVKVYTDNPCNRKLGRVGKPRGSEVQHKETGTVTHETFKDNKLNRQLDGKKNRKPNDGTKNIKQWDDAITEKDEEAMRELLKAGKLPNSSQISHAIQVFGRESDAMTRICRDVSRRILNRDDQIVRVEPAYESPDEDDVTFIVYVKQPQTDLNFADLEVKVVKRVIGQYSSDGRDIVDREVRENLQFTLEEAKRLRTCLEKHSKPLMEKHSNLQMISASHFKSKNYGNESLKKTMCVVLYVRVKGFIPLTEERLPNKLDEIPTDIREGGFEFLSHAGERHTHLKMGCEITGSKGSGTIGPFLKHEGNTYCLTAAHVLVGPPVDNTTLPSMTSAGQDPIHVYQPNPARSKSVLKHTPFGSVHFFKYSKGGDVPGIDAAAILIQDEKRLPNSGEFPESAIVKEDDSHMEVDVDENAVQNLKYISGKVCDRNFFKENNAVEILKFGAVTGATRGLLHIVGTSVRYAKLLAENVNNWELYAQIEISNSLEGQIFADHGDSGAVVLVSYGGSRNDLRALGLLIGKSSTGRILATPMHAVLEEFGLTNSHIMAFQASTHADTQRQDEDTSLKAKFESIEKAMTDNKNETSAIRSQVDALSTNFERFAGKMLQMMPNQIANQSDKNQNSGN